MSNNKILEENHILLKENETAIQKMFKSIPILISIVGLMLTLLTYLVNYTIKVNTIENKVTMIETTQAKLTKENEDSRIIETQFRVDIQTIKDTMVEIKDVVKTALRQTKQ